MSLNLKLSVFLYVRQNRLPVGIRVMAFGRAANFNAALFVIFFIKPFSRSIVQLVLRRYLSVSHSDEPIFMLCGKNILAKDFASTHEPRQSDYNGSYALLEEPRPKFCATINPRVIFSSRTPRPRPQVRVSESFRSNEDENTLPGSYQVR